MLYPESRHLFLRKTRASLTESGLVTYENHVLGSDHPILTSSPNLRKVRQSYRYANGSQIIVGGMDNPERTLSTEYDTIYVQEVTELELEEYETLMRALRNGKMPYTQMLSDCNPTYPHHWVYKRFNGDRPKLTNFTTTHKDNPRFWDRLAGRWTVEGERYLATLGNMTGHRRKRFLEGVWAAAEGLVYERFGPHNLLPRGWQPPKEWKRYHALDFGYVNPLCYQFWAEDHDGRLYLYREIYRTGMLVEDLAKYVAQEIRPNSQGVAAEPRPQAIVTDHDDEDRATFEKHSGLKVTPADKGIIAGIQDVQKRLELQNDGKPRLYVVAGANFRSDPVLSAAGKPICTEEEFAGYVWDPDGYDEPVDENNHGMDAARYLVRHRDGKPVYRGVL